MMWAMDEELVVRAQQGDRQAFESLTLAHYTRLYRVAGEHPPRDRPTAEDATQQALLDIWRYIRRLRDPRQVERLVLRLLVHACYAEAKRAATTVGEVESCPATSPLPRDDYRSVMERDALERAFRKMPLDHRTVIVLRHLIGMTPKRSPMSSASLGRPSTPDSDEPKQRCGLLLKPMPGFQGHLHLGGRS